MSARAQTSYSLLADNIERQKKQGGGDGNKLSRNGFEIAQSLFIGTLKRSVVRLYV